MSQTRPSNVLYIRTPPEMGDRELEQLCRAEAGFVILRKMRFFSFAEYATIDDATRAMRHLSQQSWRGVPLSVDFDKGFFYFYFYFYFSNYISRANRFFPAVQIACPAPSNFQ